MLAVQNEALWLRNENLNCLNCCRPNDLYWIKLKTGTHFKPKSCPNVSVIYSITPYFGVKVESTGMAIPNCPQRCAPLHK
jgi:hypothetical protein